MIGASEARSLEAAGEAREAAINECALKAELQLGKYERGSREWQAVHDAAMSIRLLNAK